jgi:hypothetical protein
LGSPRANARAKPNTSLIRKFRFWSWLRNSSLFLAVVFFQISLLSGFQRAGFQVLVSSLNKFSFFSKVSGWFCPVAKTGFKFFRLRFGLRWF